MTSNYHQSVLHALSESGACSAEQLSEVETLLRGLSGECAADAPQIWRHVTARILLPSHDFAVHVRLMAAVYDGWPEAKLGRPPLWLPDPSEAHHTNLAKFLSSIQGEGWWQAAVDHWAGSAPAADRQLIMQLQQHQLLQQQRRQGQRQGDQPQPQQSAELLLLQWRLLQAESWDGPEGFWPAVLRALGIRFAVPPERALLRHPTDPDRCRWLPGARLNAAACALESPRAPPGCPALLWAPDGSPRSLRPMGRDELRARVHHLAACIRTHFKIGDPLAVYLPLSPEAVCLYLAIVLCGCVVVSVADSFSAEELEARAAIAGAVGLFTQDVVLRGGRSLPLYDKVVRSGTRARAVVLPAAAEGVYSPAAPPLRPGDLHWTAFTASVSAPSSSSSSGGGGGGVFQPHIADAYEVTNVLFSSGTTGDPKAIPWTHLTPLRCALDAWAHLDVRPGGVLAWPTSLGWMMGPWLIYAGLINGATVALYGGAPLGRDFLEFVEAARVDVLGVVPSIVRAWRHGGGAGGAGGVGSQEGPTPGSAATDGVDLSCVRVFGSTGEASAAEEYAWLMSRARGYRPVVEYCGGTEIGGGYVSSTLLHPAAPSTFTTPTLGTRLVLLSPHKGLAPGGELVMRLEDGQRGGIWDRPPRPDVDVDGISGSGSKHIGLADRAGGVVSGEVALVMPMFGVSQRLLNKDHYKVYYKGMPTYCGTAMPLRRHGDELAALPAGGPGPSPWAFCALGRCDDTMNLGGIKVSSVELERAVVEVLAEVAEVAEVAAVGAPPQQGGPEELTLFVVLRPPPLTQQPQHQQAAATGASAAPAPVARQSQEAGLRRRCQEAVRARLNPLFKVSRVVVVPSLPRNASNKVMRRVLRDELMSAAAAAAAAKEEPTRSKL